VLTGFLDSETARLTRLLTGSFKGVVESRSLADMGLDGLLKVTHLVLTKPINKRTTKLCAAISTVPYIVTSEWIKACESAGKFVLPDPYVIDGPHEGGSGAGAWSFDASESRKRAQLAPLLAGTKFVVLTDPEKDFKVIIRANGGEVLEKGQAKKEGGFVVVSTEERRADWKKLAERPDVQVVNGAHLLTCVMRQELDLSEGALA